MCNIAAKSTKASVKNPLIVNLRGVMLGVTGNLLGRVQDRIEYDYGRWCGEELLGKYR